MITDDPTQLRRSPGFRNHPTRPLVRCGIPSHIVSGKRCIREALETTARGIEVKHFAESCVTSNPLAAEAPRRPSSQRKFENLMSALSRYTINAPDVVAEDIDGDVVILNLAKGHYFNLGGVAGPIWSFLLAGHTPQSIFMSIEVRRPELVDGSAKFVQRLIELNLICPRHEADAFSTETIDELWSGDGPTIEIYDDLAELIFADPIHDVDEETGWPSPRKK